LQDAITYFADGERALEFMKLLRWPDGVVKCARCESGNVLFLKNARRWKCRACKNQLSAKVGTIFEDSPLSLSKWIPALWVIVNAKNGISSCELGRALGVTQKMAWFMLHRVRLAMQNGSVVKIGGQVEADETFIGGRARFMHKSQKGKKRSGPWNKTPVMELLERSTAKRANRVILKVAASVRKGELQANVRQYVLKGSEVHTDQLLSYEGLADKYTHNVINHAESYVRGHVHTNGMENF
jgi:transposase-like protein